MRRYVAMVLKSMTGYGRAETERRGRIWSVEVRCVNNRFLDARIRLPRDCNALEEPVRKIVGEYHQRGRVDLAVTVSGDFSDLMEVHVNTDLARSYKQALEDVAQRLGVPVRVDAALLAGLPDVLSREQRGEDLAQIWPQLESAIRRALEACSEMRECEAQALKADLVSRLQTFTRLLHEIEQKLPRIVEQRHRALQERVGKLLGSVDADPMRLAQEIAVLADKSDVTEEVVRLRSHIVQFEGMLQATEAVGRTLDFLIQEFLREVNTMASKINDAEIAHQTVALKSELEKMREQVQNIE